jgi:hypothetical protein
MPADTSEIVPNCNRAWTMRKEMDLPIDEFIGQLIHTIDQLAKHADDYGKDYATMSTAQWVINLEQLRGNQTQSDPE